MMAFSGVSFCSVHVISPRVHVCLRLCWFWRKLYWIPSASKDSTEMSTMQPHNLFFNVVRGRFGETHNTSIPPRLVCHR